MTTAQFFKIDSNTPQTDASWINAFGSSLSEAVTSVATNGLPVQLKLSVGWIAGTQFDYAADEVSLLVEETNDPNTIKVGDELYAIDTITDTAIVTLITAGVLTAAGITSSVSVVGLAVAGGIGYVYSKFGDPVTDDLILTLAGRDTVKVLNATGNLHAGYVYPDGISGDYTDVMHAVISDSRLNGPDIFNRFQHVHEPHLFQT